MSLYSPHSKSDTKKDLVRFYSQVSNYDSMILNNETSIVSILFKKDTLIVLPLRWIVYIQNININVIFKTQLVVLALHA